MALNNIFAPTRFSIVKPAHWHGAR